MELPDFSNFTGFFVLFSLAREAKGRKTEREVLLSAKVLLNAKALLNCIARLDY